LKADLNNQFYLHQDEFELLENANKYVKLFDLPRIEIPKVDHFFTEETELRFNSMVINLIFTPGHTAGGTSFIIENHLFSGDTLFLGSVGRTDLPGGNQDLLIKSIKSKLMNLNDKIIVHCGHGPDTTIENEKYNNPFLN